MMVPRRMRISQAIAAPRARVVAGPEPLGKVGCQSRGVGRQVPDPIVPRIISRESHRRNLSLERRENRLGESPHPSDCFQNAPPQRAAAKCQTGSNRCACRLRSRDRTSPQASDVGAAVVQACIQRRAGNQSGRPIITNLHHSGRNGAMKRLHTLFVGRLHVLVHRDSIPLTSATSRARRA
jgi:hypothetical protein